MKTVKKYGWTLKLIGAALLIALALVLEIGKRTDIVVAFIGAVIIIYSVVRLVPYVKTQGSDLIKTINIIEITVDVMIGIALIVVEMSVDGGLGDALGYILGAYLIIRGAVHFYGVSEGKEKSDLVLYFFHIAALVAGGFIVFQGNVDAMLIIHIILFFSVVVGGYLIYDGGKGYKIYRYEKSVYQQSVTGVKPTESKEVPIVDEVEERPSVVS